MSKRAEQGRKQNGKDEFLEQESTSKVAETGVEAGQEPKPRTGAEAKGRGAEPEGREARMAAGEKRPGSPEWFSGDAVNIRETVEMADGRTLVFDSAPPAKIRPMWKWWTRRA